MFWLKYAIVTPVTGVSIFPPTRARRGNNTELGVTGVPESHEANR